MYRYQPVCRHIYGGFEIVKVVLFGFSGGSRRASDYVTYRGLGLECLIKPNRSASRSLRVRHRKRGRVSLFLRTAYIHEHVIYGIRLCTSWICISVTHSTNARSGAGRLFLFSFLLFSQLFFPYFLRLEIYSRLIDITSVEQNKCLIMRYINLYIHWGYRQRLMIHIYFVASDIANLL